MRFLFMFLFVGFISSYAHAQVDPDPYPPQDPPAQTSFSFYLSSPSAGCVNVDSVSASEDVPNLKNGVVTEVRLYYSNESFEKITQNSPYMESELISDTATNTLTLASPNACGFQSGKTFFKYGLIDTNGAVLKFMDDSEYSEYQDSVEVQ